jgi:ribosome maturation factor RimP
LRLEDNTFIFMLRKWVIQPTFLLYISFGLNMSADVSGIVDIIRPVFETNHVYLVDMEFRGKGRDRVLSIFVDTEEGITLSQITQLNQNISDLLDMHNVISGPYRLEISSPGLDRPLKYLWQYQKNIGRKLQVNYRDKETIKEVTGKLINAAEEGILIESKSDKLKIPLSEITKSKVKISI